MVSVPVVPKLNPNHVGIGSRTERLRVRKEEILVNQKFTRIPSFRTET